MVQSVHCNKYSVRSHGVRFRFLIRAYKARYRDQKLELAEIRKHVRRDDVACDVGAHKGSYLYWLALWCRDGLVIAFEPQPVLADYLKTIAKLFPLRFRNVIIEQKAVSSCCGTLDLYVPQEGSPGASLVRRAVTEVHNTVAVPTVSLDEVFKDYKRRVALLKIDVEGAELEVFKGAERLLTRDGPLLVFECENRHLENGRVEDVLAYLAALGYDGHFVDGDRLRPVAQFDAALHQKEQGEGFWNRAGYCNNFIFAKRPAGDHTGRL